MNGTIARLIAIPLLSAIVLFSIKLNAQTKVAQVATPKLANIIINTDPKATSSLSCLQLLPNETITVYAVGLDEKGKPFAISKDSIVHWRGGDALEVKSTAAHSATVKLAKPLKAAVSSLSATISYEGKRVGASTSIAQKVKELPKKFMVAFFRDPTKDKTIDIEKMKVGESITVYVRGMSSDIATMGEIFTLPPDANVSWKSAPSPPIGAEIRITQIGCYSAKIDIVKPAQMEGMPNSIKVELDLKDGTKKEAAFSIEIVK